MVFKLVKSSSPLLGAIVLGVSSLAFFVSFRRVSFSLGKFKMGFIKEPGSVYPN